ncbi:alpha/beta-hydrolase [Aspergillus steynii IBT 23096]|uniref:Alpha/beta-hydrolase n=1 Tax=Aspergillus steynii IBT 23096 TaxID=1392250 RepID=A0A2I2FYU9_9EURO|nr:alpha/beta-hydrolase [Aspergillus steynii IBT 23096]PLB45813.1 alpha/beta-hydrolase [Aspergillus steynii IBT 23096]
MTDIREKPTILLIPGAWHLGSTFEPVANILRAQGYQAETVTLPSAGGPSTTTAYDDADHIRKAYLNDLIAQGKEVILVLHSYAGVPGTESVKGLARKDLAAQGKKGGVVGLIYQAAFLVPAGASVESFLPSGLDPFMTLEDNKMYPKNPRESFYNDMDDETAAKHLAALVHHAPEAMRTPMTYEAYRDVPTSYILCNLDASFSLAAQQMVAGIPGEGVVRTYPVDGGHFAMLSQPQAVAEVIQEIAGTVTYV